MPSAEQFLPLKPDVLVILLVLRDGERHGYALMREAEVRSEGAVRLQTGALYRTLKRLLDDGLVSEAPPPADAETDDERRRYYRLTRLGLAVVSAESQRLARLLADASGGRRTRLA